MTETPEQDLRPMTIREAIECAKIFIPHVEDLRMATDGWSLVRAIYRVMSGERSVDLLRAMALMEHVDVAEVLEKYRRLGVKSMLMGLRRDFQANPLPDLMEAAAALRLTEKRWSHARPG